MYLIIHFALQGIWIYSLWDNTIGYKINVIIMMMMMMMIMTITT